MTEAARPGHVFVVQADLTKVVCDEVLIPTDRWLHVMPHWDPLEPLREGRLLPSGWASDRIRITDRLPDVEGLPQRRMVNSGATTGDPVAWLLESVDQALSAATRALAAGGSRTGRAVPLLALPVLGTGAGGFSDRRGEVLDGLLARCRAAAAASGVDIAVVCHDRSDFTAVQARRSQQDRRLTRTLAKRLGLLARSQQLALFLGAGVSAGAGLPDWATLLERVAAADPRTEVLPETWSTSDLWDRAAHLQAKLGSDGLAAAVEQQLSQSRFALSHALLASLPGREVVTTNFDALFESARRNRQPAPRLEVLPYVRGGGAYLLKLHGDAKLRDIVLDRRAMEDYDTTLRPLAGLLQGLLLTRHLLFVGCSMTDDNVVRNVDQVAALVKHYRHVDSVGTVLTLLPDDGLATTWRAKGFEVEAATTEPTMTDRQAARELEVLVDEVLLEATYDEGGHLLDERYAALLEGDVQKQLAATLRTAASSLPTGREWEGLRRALEAHGATTN